MMIRNVTTRAPRSLARRRRQRAARTAVVAAAVAAILAGGGYAVACALMPLPGLTVQLSVPAERQIPADGTADGTADSPAEPTAEQFAATAQALVDSQARPTAVGWKDDEKVWANDQTAYPLASVSKLITVLVTMEQQPLEPGADGPIHVWSQEDADRSTAFLADDGVAYNVPVGTRMTTRQMLTVIFLPSANDFAAAYAYSVFEDNEAFLAAVEAWKARNGLESVQFVEPTGMDERNVASAPDLVRIARLALANPTVSEFTKTVSADMPWGIGLLENTNPLLTKRPGMLGVKTGRSASAGFNLIAAQQIDAMGREIVQISVTLGRSSVAERAATGAAMLDALEQLPRSFPTVTIGEQVGTATTIEGRKIPLIIGGGSGPDAAEPDAAGPETTVLVPGERASVTVKLEAIAAGAAGSEVGRVRVQSPGGDQAFPIVTASEITEPGLWWRLTHPAAVFGWV